MLNANDDDEVWHNLFFMLLSYYLWQHFVIGEVEEITDSHGDNSGKGDLHVKRSTFNLIFHNAETMNKAAI